MVVKKAKKAIQPAPYSIGGVKKEKVAKKKTQHPLIRARPRTSRIGQGIQNKRDLTRYVKWPKYVRIQRQEKILTQRLKAPPAVNQFNVTLDGKIERTLYKFAKSYMPETKQQKKARLLALANQRVEAQDNKQEVIPSLKKPCVLKCGLNHVTTLIEQKKALLVIIARDVQPIELIVWLPALCRKMDVPFVIVKSKAKLGTLVNKKTATCLAFTRIKPEHQARFNLIQKSIQINFESRSENARKKWSVPVLSAKSRANLNPELSLAPAAASTT